MCVSVCVWVRVGVRATVKGGRVRWVADVCGFVCVCECPCAGFGTGDAEPPVWLDRAGIGWVDLVRAMKLHGKKIRRAHLKA